MTNEIPVTIVGNLTSPPELRYTANGLAVANFTIAQTPRVFDKQANEYKDGETTFLRASCWREFAEHVAGSLDKGTRVVATGVLQARSYETKEGEKRTALEMKVEAIGPDLRYSIASVSKAQSNRGAEAFYAGASQAGDSWATTAVPTDETPF